VPGFFVSNIPLNDDKRRSGWLAQERRRTMERDKPERESGKPLDHSRTETAISEQSELGSDGAGDDASRPDMDKRDAPDQATPR
jgi:hypothetical protein